MPKNPRPPGWIVTDPDWEGTTRAERRNAQNTYDLLVEQEKANNLAQEKLKQDRENAEMQAQATIQATIQAEKDRFLYQALLQQSQQNFEEEQRKIRLCDNLGIDYEDIKEFDTYLYLGDGVKNNRIDELNTIISNKEKTLRNYRDNRPNEKSIKEQYKRQISNIESKIRFAKTETEYSTQGIYLGIIDMLVIFFLIMGCFPRYRLRFI